MTSLPSFTRALNPIFTLSEGVAGDRVEITKHASPGNYSTTKACLVVQHQEDNGGAELANGSAVECALFVFTDAAQGDTASASSSGVVTSRGLRSATNKTYDGSAQCFTASFELDQNGNDLGFSGAEGYNEGGAFQALMTNIGSSNGFMSGGEVHLRDSPNDGTDDYATRMTGFAAGIKKYNSSSLPSYNFHALNEGSTGSLDLDAVLKIEGRGNGAWKTGIDFYDDGSWDFATLISFQMKENNKVRWTDGTNHTDLYVNANGIMVASIAGSRFIPGTDNDKQLGGASNRWSEVFAGNGTINTSDETEKQDIGSIPDAVLDAWADVEWVSYRWRDAVTKKGSAARSHTGLVAQRVERAFADHGLDAREWGVLCVDRLDDGSERYSVRYDEAFALEAALTRRAIVLRKE